MVTHVIISMSPTLLDTEPKLNPRMIKLIGGMGILVNTI